VGTGDTSALPPYSATRPPHAPHYADAFPGRSVKLKVHAQKSAVDRPQNRSFLGFSFTGGKSPDRRKVAPKALDRFKARVKALTKRNQGHSLQHVITTLNQYLQGWKGYFGCCQTPTVLRDADSWIRHRLRCLQWQHWKVYRRWKAELSKRGATHSWHTLPRGVAKIHGLSAIPQGYG
jgi:RNA-directed DNA polymerase